VVIHQSIYVVISLIGNIEVDESRFEVTSLAIGANANAHFNCNVDPSAREGGSSSMKQN